MMYAKSFITHVYLRPEAYISDLQTFCQKLGSYGQAQAIGWWTLLGLYLPHLPR